MSSIPGSSVPAAPSSMKTRIRLLEAARLEFGEKGIECATTRSIAERAGCNEVTLFRHFESKHKLLAAVVHATSERFRTICSSPDLLSGDLREDLKRFAEAYSQSLDECEGMIRAMVGEGRLRPTLCKELIGDVIEPLHRRLADFVQQQISLGKVRPDTDAMVFSELFTSTLMGGLLRRTSGLSNLDQDGWNRETVEFFARALETAQPS